MSRTRTRPNPMRMVSPCAHCPFRCDRPTYLRHERAQELATALLSGNSFTCHETTIPTDDYDGSTEMVDGPNAAHCAGAMAILEKMGASNQMMRIAERLGQYNPEQIRKDAPVYDSLSDWVRAHAPTDLDEPEAEHCGIAGPSCVDPAGWGFTGGGVLENTDEPTCTDWCESCGSAMCEACVSEDNTTLCIYCQEVIDDDDDTDD